MLRAPRIALLVALCALLLAPAAGGRADAGSVAADELYWLGPYFAGLRLTDTRDGGFAYGDLECAPAEGGCSLPIRVQNATSCERNPIGFGSAPHQVFPLRGGGIAVVYESNEVDVGTGHRTVTVSAEEFELAKAALRDVRTRSQPAPQPLPAPVYPLPVLRELKRVTAVEGRLGGIRAIAEATDLPPDQVRLRLRIAELLGPEALAGVPAPTMSTATVERLLQLAYGAQVHPLSHTARNHGMTVAELRAKLRLVRGLAGDC